MQNITKDGSLFPHQVGFVGPGAYFDASPSDFLRLSPEQVGVLSASVSQIECPLGLTNVLTEIMSPAKTLAMNGASIVAQVGTNWTSLGAASFDDASAYCDRMSDVIGVPFISALLSLGTVMRRNGYARIALNTTYASADWTMRLSAFFKASNFEVVYSGSFADQGLFQARNLMSDRRGLFPINWAQTSMERVAALAPNVDSLVVTGIPSFFES